MSSLASLPLLNCDADGINGIRRGNQKPGTYFIQACLILSLSACILMLASNQTNTLWTSSVTKYPPDYIFRNVSTTKGPFRVLTSTVHVGGYQCGGSQNAIVFYPADTTHNYPLISFAHGLGSGGHEVLVDYRSLLVGLSSWGFIVIAPESARHMYCEHIDKDQLRSIEYAMHAQQPCFYQLDLAAGVGVVGHSMGGQGTVRAATKSNILPVAAAVALHPVFTMAARYVKVPILYGTAENDLYVPSKLVRDMYDITTNVTKIFANMAKANHHEPGKKGHDRWTNIVAAFMGCHLQHAFLSCEEIYGVQPFMITADDDAVNEEMCQLCDCDRVPMVQCKREIHVDPS